MLVVLVLFLGVIEGAARLFFEEPPDAPILLPTRDGWKTSEIHRSDPYLFWRNRADASLVYKGVDVTTNSLGMRDDPTTRTKPPGAFRILSLGESTTFGSKVEQDELYGAVLERCLSERLPERDVEVLNMGTPGWSLVQSYVYLEREGFDLDPDIVMIYHGFNDALPTSYTSRRNEAAGIEGHGDGTDLALAERPRGGLERFGAWLHARSLAFRWVGHRMKSLSQSQEPQKSVDEAQPEAERDDAGGASENGAGREGAGREGAGVPGERVPGERVPEGDRREVLRRMLEMTQRHGCRLVILVPCYRSFDQHRTVLEEFAWQNDVPLIDLEASIEALGGDRQALFADGSHPKAVVHAEYAAQICSFLLSEGLVAEPQ